MTDRQDRIIIDQIKNTLVNGDLSLIRKVLREAHQADVADAIEELGRKQRLEFFRKVKPELVSDVFEEIDNAIQVEVIQEVQPKRALHWIDHMEPDDLADLLHELRDENEEKADELLQGLADNKDVEDLLQYHDQVAGGIMNPNFVVLPEKLTAKEAIAAFRLADPPDRDFAYYLYIINDEGHLVGVTSLRDLVLADSSKKVKELRKENLITVQVDTDQEEVARIMAKYDLIALPVISLENKMVGIITVDDVVDVIEEEATEDLFKLSGTSSGQVDEEDLLSGRIWESAKSRMRWLLLTMVGGLLSGSLLSIFAVHFDNITLSLPIILSFIPLLVGLGGNIGNQSATIMVRGLATGHIREETVYKNISREILVSLIIGLCVGFILFIGSFFLYKTMEYGILIAIAILLNVMLSAVFGTLLPVFFTKIGADPAIASAPFISSSIDVMGLFIYFLIISSYLFFKF